MKEILKRLESLEKIIVIDAEVGTFDSFLNFWAVIDPLSQSLFLMMTECPEIFGELSPNEKKIVSYIKRMGLVSQTVSLSDILKGLGDSIV